MRGWPHTGCRTLGRSERIRFPFPAASTTACTCSIHPSRGAPIRYSVAAKTTPALRFLTDSPERHRPLPAGAMGEPPNPAEGHERALRQAQGESSTVALRLTSLAQGTRLVQKAMAEGHERLRREADESSGCGARTRTPI